MANMVDGTISLSNFDQKFPDSERIMTRGIVMVQDPSIRPKFRSRRTASRNLANISK
jgi:hypothetical protein